MSDFPLREFARAANSAIVTAIIFFIAVLGASKLDPTSAHAATSGTWTNATTGGLWSDPNNWSGGKIADGINSVANFSTLDITADNTVNLDSSRTVGELIFGDTAPSNNWILSGLGALTLADLSASAVPVIQVNNDAATIAVAISGSQGLAVQGHGTLILAGVNTFTGTTNVAAGNTHLLVASAGALQDSTVLAFPSNISFSPGIGTFTFGNVQFPGGFALNDTSGAPILLRVGNNSGDFNAPYLSGSGSLQKIGSGTLTYITPEPSFTGDTIISGAQS